MTPELGPVWLQACFTWLPAAALAAFLGALAVSRGERSAPGAVLGLVGALACALCVGLIAWTALRPPLLGSLEAGGETAFLLSALALADWLAGGPGRAAARWSWAGCAALLLVVLAMPRSINPDSFMFAYPGAIIFFQMRLVAMALLLHAGARHLAGGFNNGGRRLLLLAGLAAFLLSEMAGATWSFQWTGEFWHWNRGFLESAALFMVIALPLHLPPRWAAVPGLARGAGVLPGAVIAAVTLIHQIMETQ